VEVLALEDLAQRVPTNLVERIEFHLFALYAHGRCVHEVDFTRHACASGTLVHARPGQVQSWRLGPGIGGYALLFTPVFLFPDRARTGAVWTERFFEDVDWPVALQLKSADGAAIRSGFERLAQISLEVDESPLSAALLRHMVSALLLDVARRCGLGQRPSRVGAEERARARKLHDDVERSYRITRNVADYAESQQCSPRTLDRACRVAFGTSAKGYVDARVVLEARRLLAHTTMTVAQIGEELGFTEATNFVKFFKARTGELPGAFREKLASSWGRPMAPAR
jgi:AraC-like DNA-binding protein